MKGNKPASSVQRLIELGYCQPSDIRRARKEAEALSSPAYAPGLRRAAKLMGAAADQTRVKILMLLAEREMCVCELESALEVAQPTASHHLKVLEEAGLVERSKKERWVFYRASSSSLMGLLKELVKQ